MSAENVLKLIRVLAAAAVVAVGAASFARADNAAAESRYPYDPVCSWGRVADGRGMLMRCLTRTESEQLSRARAASSAAPPSSGAAGVASGSAVRAEPAPAELDRNDKVELEIGPLVADTGRLPLGDKKLKEPRDRYLDCVRRNGGISEATAEITLRFLVRERGRAEGVSVTKRRGVSTAAARCLADVVDRRYVGVPEEPLVGANLTLKFSKRAK